MITPLHVVDEESMNDATMADQRKLNETLVMVAMGLSNNEIIGVETDDTIINGDKGRCYGSYVNSANPVSLGMSMVDLVWN